MYIELIVRAVSQDLLKNVITVSLGSSDVPLLTDTLPNLTSINCEGLCSGKCTTPLCNRIGPFSIELHVLPFLHFLWEITIQRHASQGGARNSELAGVGAFVHLDVSSVTEGQPVQGLSPNVCKERLSSVMAMNKGRISIIGHIQGI